LDNCRSIDTVVYNQQILNLPTYGECYQSSLSYTLYRGIDIDTSLYKLAWQSDQLSASGYLLRNDILTMVDFSVNDVNDALISQLINDQVAPLNNGLLFNGFIGPELKIYQVLSNKE